MAEFTRREFTAGMAALLVPELPLGADSSGYPRRLQDKEAAKLYEDGKYEEAYKAYKSIAKRDQKNAKARFRLGFVCGELKKYDEGLEWLKKAKKLNPDSYKWEFSRKEVAEKVKMANSIHKTEPDKATAILEDVAKLEPGHPRINYHLACAQHSKDREKALDTMKSAMKADPNFHAAYNMTGLWMGQGKKDYEAAIFYFRAYLTVFPDAPAQDFYQEMLEKWKAKLPTEKK